MNNLLHQPTILLIENDSKWLIDVYSVLQEAGYDILIANGGSEGFCLAQRFRPDLIISDAALTDIPGVQLCRMIRADRDLNALLFILLGESGDESSDISAKAFEAGTDDYLYEDCSPRFLAAKIKRLIDLQRAETEIQFNYQKLHRSEQHLARLIEDTSKLISSINPAIINTAAGQSHARKSRNFFERNVEPKKQFAGNSIPHMKKNDDAIAAWKQLLQVKSHDDLDELGGDGFGKTCYEIAS